MNKRKIKLGCAPINWTNDDLPALGGDLSFEQCVSEMALAGFYGSEIGVKYPKDKEVLKKALDLRGLVICNGWFSSLLSAQPVEKTLNSFCKHMDFLFDLGARIVGVGECGVTIHGNESIPLSHAPVLSDTQFKNIANGLNRMGEIAKTKGMELAFHYHIGTGIQTREEIDRLMAMTDKELVGLVLDSGHATLAGVDPVNLIHTYPNRIKHVHLKDLRKRIFNQLKAEDWSFLKGIKQGLFTVPGDGDMVDWNGVFNALTEIKYEGWIVIEAEQDPHKYNPLEYAIKARQFIKEKMGI